MTATRQHQSQFQVMQLAAAGSGLLHAAIARCNDNCRHLKLSSLHED